MAAGPETPLERLLAAGRGGTPAPAEEAWRAWVEHVAETLDIGPGTGVYDVTCGAGAFLYPLWENGYRVGGLSDSDAGCAQAQAAMSGGRFATGAPRDLDPAEPWDVVLASHTGELAGTADDVRAALARMAAKATHAIALLEVDEPGDGDGSAVRNGVREDGDAGTGPGGRARLLRLLAEIGVAAVRFEHGPDGRLHVFARV